MTFVVHTTGDPADMAPAVQRALREIDPNQPISEVRTMQQVMADRVGRARFNTLLLGLFAGLATLLVCYIPAQRAMRVDPLIALRYE